MKGLPLHIQIDTYEDPRDATAPVYHRGYCQIKVCLYENRFILNEEVTQIKLRF